MHDIRLRSQQRCSQLKTNTHSREYSMYVKLQTIYRERMKVTFNVVNYSDQRAETAVKCDEMSTSCTSLCYIITCVYVVHTFGDSLTRTDNKTSLSLPPPRPRRICFRRIVYLFFVCLFVSNFAQKLQGRLATGQ